MSPGCRSEALQSAKLQLLLFLVGAVSLLGSSADPLSLKSRHREPVTGTPGQWQVVEKPLRWAAPGTAIVVCDMWDRHWCPSATARVAEMAPRMNHTLKAARTAGVFVIHCPSDTLNFYQDHPGRKRAAAAPKVAPPVPLKNWWSLEAPIEGSLPIDDSNGGCEGCEGCEQKRAWSRQIEAIEIHPGDAITDSAEAYYLMRQRAITNVIIMGVHVNMCVLGRPFGIRQLRHQGQNVVLMRDLTDAMYSSGSAPYVNHFRGTELVVEHIEKHWCPTITSADLLGGEPFRFREDRPRKVVFLIGEDEYQTWETLPEFAQNLVAWRGFQTAVIQANPDNKHDFPGLMEHLQNADALVVSVRRRALPQPQVDAIRAHLAAGKPLVGIRTTSHAFAPKGNDAKLGASWPEFDAQVLGGNYQNHHGNNLASRIEAAPDAIADGLLNGVSVRELIGHGSLYKNTPLRPDTRVLLTGTIPGQPTEPVAWTHAYGPCQARIFYTSLGHPDDFADPHFRRLLLNGLLWAMGEPIPPDNRLQSFQKGP